jgi:hypothetical protein
MKKLLGYSQTSVAARLRGKQSSRHPFGLMIFGIRDGIEQLCRDSAQAVACEQGTHVVSA